MSFKDPLDEKSGAPRPAGSPEGGAEVEVGHLPVMVDEVIETLAPRSGSLQIDATLGGAGHAERVLEASSPGGRLLGLDADEAAIARSARRLARFGDRAVLRQANFGELAEVAPAAASARSTACCWIWACRASSSPTWSAASGSGPAAVWTCASTRAAAGRPRICWPRWIRTSWRRCSAATARSRSPAASPGRSSRRGATPRWRRPSSWRRSSSGPCRRRRLAGRTRPRASSRRCVSPSTTSWRPRGRPGASLVLLRPGGRLVVLSYHSLEDRIVKRFIAAEQRGCVCPPEVPICVCGRNPNLRSLGKSRTPSAGEVAANPRSRSARLRGAERIAA
jgi:16S rRNA (cytosine1402-N4)-methyltransferase